MSDEHIKPTLKKDNFITVPLKFFFAVGMKKLKARTKQTERKNKSQVDIRSCLIFICFIVVI